MTPEHIEHRLRDREQGDPDELESLLRPRTRRERAGLR
jgi:hypothetical protein